MKYNPSLVSMASFRKIIAGDNVIFENEYGFELCPSVAGALANVPRGSHLHLKIQENCSCDIKMLPEECSGWRLSFGHFTLYLSTSGKDVPANGKIPDHIMRIHDSHLKNGLYYPKKDDILNYWKYPNDILNGAELYLGHEQISRSIYLRDLIKNKCDPITSALELGCNVGRNLNCLKNDLGVDVAGIEISEHALTLMKSTYPALQESKTYIGNMTDVIADIKDNSHDLVFSMAVLMHLHPTTPDSFWSNVIRIAKKHIIIIENENGFATRNWPRNYQKLFESCGAKQIYEESGKHIMSGEYVTRVFRSV